MHPLATESPVLVHDVDPHTANLTFTVQIHSDRVAVHFISHGMAPSELVVWNWKTGETLLVRQHQLPLRVLTSGPIQSTYSVNLMAFAFLTERLILVGGFGDVEFNLSQPRLFVVDLDSSKGERTEFDRVEYLCAFLYPACHPWVHALSFLIRSDPCTDWSPHPSVQVPFSIGPGPRLYVVTIWLMQVQGEEVTPIDLFVLSSTLLDRVDTLGEGETRHDFEWSEWGPAGTRMIAQAPHSHVWVCYVFGTRFSSIIGGGRLARDGRMLEVWDFNQVGIRRDIGREKGESCEVEWHVGDTSVLSSRMFDGEVRTRLPYRVLRRKLAAPSKGEPVFTEAMCSEDNVILVDVSVSFPLGVELSTMPDTGTTLSDFDVLREM